MLLMTSQTLKGIMPVGAQCFCYKRRQFTGQLGGSTAVLCFQQLLHEDETAFCTDTLAFAQPAE